MLNLVSFYLPSKVAVLMNLSDIISLHGDKRNDGIFQLKGVVCLPFKAFQLDLLAFFAFATMMAAVADARSIIFWRDSHLFPSLFFLSSSSLT